jgi:D-galactarolactone cycloisomerase
MKITEIRTIRLYAPLSACGQVRTRTGTRRQRYATLLEVRTDQGITGLGSCSGNGPLVEAVVSRVLAPLLIGMDPCAIQEIWDKSYFGAGVRMFGSRGIGVVALSGVDTALWDIRGKAEGRPVYELLGGACRNEVEVYATALYPEVPEAVVDKALAFVEQGFRGIKIKVGFDLAEDITIVKAVRKALGDAYPLMTDANMGYELAPALEAARAYRELGIQWLEEPLFLEDVEGHARLRAESGIPIAVGENLHTRFAFEGFLTRDAVDFLQPDVARAGGVSEVCKIAALARARNRPISLHTYGDGIALAASLHLATAIANSTVMEFDTLENPLRSDLLAEPLIPDNGCMRAPRGPGLGVALDPEALERYRYDGEDDLALRHKPIAHNH